jgi:predicted nucleic acid-binding Zn ribbon protein
MPYKDKDKNREYQRLWRYRDHEATLIRARKIKERYKQEGRCPKCGVNLIEGEKICCQNCSSIVFQREMKYAKDSLRLAKIM